MVPKIVEFRDGCRRARTARSAGVRSRRNPWRRCNEPACVDHAHDSAVLDRMRCGSTPRARRSGSPPRSASRCCRRCASAGPSSAFPAASTSSVTAALCVARARGEERPCACSCRRRIPIRTACGSAGWSPMALGIATVVEDIAPNLMAAGCYSRRDEFIRKLVPEFGAGWGCKVVLANALAATGYNITSLVVQSPDGEATEAAHAARRLSRHRRRHQHEAADPQADRVLSRRPAELRRRRARPTGWNTTRASSSRTATAPPTSSRSRISTRARSISSPSISAFRRRSGRRPPTTDTWSLAQTQDEFYFALPYDQMDLCLFGLNNGIPAEAVASAARLSVEQLKVVWTDIERKRRASVYLHQPPTLVEGEAAASS